MAGRLVIQKKVKDGYVALGWEIASVIDYIPVMDKDEYVKNDEFYYIVERVYDAGYTPDIWYFRDRKKAREFFRSLYKKLRTD